MHEGFILLVLSQQGAGGQRPNPAMFPDVSLSKKTGFKAKKRRQASAGEHCLLENKMKATVFYSHLKESQVKSLDEGHSICTGAEALLRWL